MHKIFICVNSVLWSEFFINSSECSFFLFFFFTFPHNEIKAYIFQGGMKNYLLSNWSMSLCLREYMMMMVMMMMMMVGGEVKSFSHRNWVWSLNSTRQWTVEKKAHEFLLDFLRGGVIPCLSSMLIWCSWIKFECCPAKRTYPHSLKSTEMLFLWWLFFFICRVGVGTHMPTSSCALLSFYTYIFCQGVVLF